MDKMIVVLWIGLFVGMLIGTFVIDPLARYMMKEARKKRIERERRTGGIEKRKSWS